MGFLSDLFSKKKASRGAVGETEKEEKRSAAARARLLETEGGVLGQELGEEDVSRRQTLLRN